MNTIQNTYINALLADASYVKLLKDDGTPLDGRTIRTNLTARVTQPQADYLLANFDIVTQTLSPTGGFDAVVWKGKARTDYADQVFVSMRGTQEGQDFKDDAVLTARGIPYNQVRDMVNWWLKATAKPGDLVKQIKVDSTITPLLNSYTFAADTSVKATGELYGQTATITAVNGHSLGGYLATAFARLFGASVGEVNTFNSAGFSDAAASNVQSEFNKIETLLGSSAQGMGSLDAVGFKQTNYRAGNGLSVTTNNWGEMPYWAVGFIQYGQKLALYQEDTLNWNPFANHSLYKQTDYLALGNALSKLDTSLSFDKLAAIIKAGSNDMKASYEGVLDAVRRVVQGTGATATQVGDAGDNAPSREDFHKNLDTLQRSDTFKALAGTLTLSASAASATAAKTDFAQFLCLYDLSPISISCSDSAAQAKLLGVRIDVASQWQSLADNFSDAWLTERSTMQSWLMAANSSDTQRADSAGATLITGQQASLTGYWQDMGSGKSVRVGNTSVGIDQLHKAIFGNAAANTLSGGVQGDALFGAAGNDQLFGKAGEDHYFAGNGANDATWMAAA